MPYRQTTTDTQTHAVNLRIRSDIRALIDNPDTLLLIAIFPGQ